MYQLQLGGAVGPGSEKVTLVRFVAFVLCWSPSPKWRNLSAYQHCFEQYYEYSTVDRLLGICHLCDVWRVCLWSGFSLPL